MFKAIPGYSLYEINCDGTSIRTTKKTRNLQKHEELTIYHDDFTGYMVVDTLNDKGQRYGVRIHRLVGLAWIPRIEEDGKDMVCHKDDIKHNNHYSNLYWGNAQDNANDKVRNTPRTENDIILYTSRDSDPNLIEQDYYYTIHQDRDEEERFAIEEIINYA